VKAIRAFSLRAQDLSWWRVSQRVQVILAVAVAVVLGLRAQSYLVDRVDLWTGLRYWAFASAFFLYGLWQARGVLVDGGMSEEAADRSGETVISRRLEIALFVAVVGVGIFLRFYRIGSIPPGLNHDAAWNGLYAIRITQGIGYAPFVACCGAVGHETMFHYVIAAFQLLVGQTKLAIQLASLSIGTATLVAFYFLIRRMFDVRVALVSTFLLGMSGWHITFSRTGWHAILIPFFEALTFYLLLVALKSRRVRDFLLAGVVLGLSLDTYDAGKAIPVSAAVFLLFLLVRNFGLIRTHFLGFVAYGLATLAAFAPLGWYALHNWDTYIGRGRSLWIGNQISQTHSWMPLWRNMGDGLLIFNFRAHGDDFFTSQPLLDVPVAAFFILGLIYSLTRLKRPEHFLLLTMLVLSLTNGVLSEPNGNRALGAVLPVSAYAGLFLVVAWRWLQRAFPGAERYLGLGLVVVLLFAAYLTYDDYLGSNPRTQWGFYPETTRVGRYVKTIADDYEVHLLAGNWPRDALTYLSYGGEGDPFQCRYTYTSNAEEVLASTDTGGCPTGQSRPPSPDRGTAYIIEAVPDYEQAFEFLRTTYPTATQAQINYQHPDGSETVVANVLLVPPRAGVVGNVTKPPGAPERDAERRLDLRLLADALTKYKAENGSYPTTGTNVQTACVYEEIDALCRFKAELGPGVFNDPFNDTEKYGYWYASDGQSFTLYALLEEAPAPQESCVAPAGLAHKRNLYCLQG
jgi:hypothetical protein